MENNITMAAKNIIEGRKCRSAWDRGVIAYSFELLEELDEAITGGYVDVDDLASPKLVKKALLNGADSWSTYSWGGCSLIYDNQIAERLCTPSELKKTDHGYKNPNKYEEWLDVQARALRQAAEIAECALVFCAK